MVKSTNPKDRIATDKLPLDLVPDTISAFAALAFAEGAAKYGAYNWRVAGVRASIYRAALDRHLKSWWNGENEDPFTGVPHLASIIACAGILLDAEIAGKLTDDRPPVVPLGEPRYVDGICFFLPDGTRVENFPEMHSQNCTAKHQATQQWFKRTVRIFKNIRNTMIERGIIGDGLAPSYFIEGLLYNVPASRFGGSEQLNFRDVLNWLMAADRNSFVCANEQFKLLGQGHVTWPAANCSEFLSAVDAFDRAA